MTTDMHNTEDFDRQKIYEKLEYRERPEWYKGKLPWTVQMQIAATNGKQYVDRVGKLKGYPQYELPVKPVSEGVMLDIGPGWGRWLVSGSRKGYIPIGADLRLEFCRSSLQTMKDHGVAGYAVAADLKELPFAEGVFDLIWSFSVIQHTHRSRLVSCLHGIRRILKPGGYTKLEFPNSEGFRNSRGPAKISSAKSDDYNSWVVRYYSIDEYRVLFQSIFKNFRYSVHSFLGIGVLKEDIRYVNGKNKLLCMVSRALTNLCRLIPTLIQKADSIYIRAYKDDGDLNSEALTEFHKLHKSRPGNNLNILPLLSCPITQQPMELCPEDAGYLINQSRTLMYPVIDSIPIMIRSEAVRVEQGTVGPLQAPD